MEAFHLRTQFVPSRTVGESYCWFTNQIIRLWPSPLKLHHKIPLHYKLVHEPRSYVMRSHDQACRLIVCRLLVQRGTTATGVHPRMMDEFGALVG